MAQIVLTMRRYREENGRGINYATSTAITAEDSAVKLSIPSVCKKEGVSDGLVNSHVQLEIGGKRIHLWCTETVAAIANLT
jgi:hypothetical protein